MSLPSSFNTESLGELKLQADAATYRPTNQNEHRFRFEPSTGEDVAGWPSLIDKLVPSLNNNWPALLSSAAGQLKQALQAIGKKGLSPEAALKHISLDDQGKACLLVSLSSSEESHSLEMVVADSSQVISINPTR